MPDDVAHILYGKGRVPLRLDPAVADWHVIRPKETPALPEPKRAFLQAVRDPIGTRPMNELVQSTDRVVIVTADGTRPVPSHLLVPWIVEELNLAPEQITVLIGTGTHRPNTPEELAEILGPDLDPRIAVVNHDAFDPGVNEQVGMAVNGTPIHLNRAYVEAEKRIVVGFIEPHFFAGFSGGPKGVAPGVASIDTIFHLHAYDVIADPNSTWGLLDENPLHQRVAEAVACCSPEFLVNVTLNNGKKITGYHCGHYQAAHRAGCNRVREEAMAPVDREFPIVVASNSGFPLDQNLYQSVKGMSAAARVVEQSGCIIMAAECSDGVPDHGNFGQMLHAAEGIEDMGQRLQAMTEPALDMWQVQVLLRIRQRCDVALFSSLTPEAVTACHLERVTDLEQGVYDRIRALGRRVPVAVMPEGPLTIPYLA
ncbi:MAG: nickel-dependent lactate racemase [bacterium]|nr:nickel-dependent lactate racemase [bacterium]